MKPANLVHVAGFCISCGIVAYYLIPRPPPQVTMADVQAAAFHFHMPVLGDKYHIWGAALVFDEQGRKAEALGCYEVYLSLDPDGPNAAKARQRIAELHKSVAAQPATISN